MPMPVTANGIHRDRLYWCRRPRTTNLVVIGNSPPHSKMVVFPKILVKCLSIGNESAHSIIAQLNGFLGKKRS